MQKKKTSVFSNGLIWFGAGVSMSEILTGTYFAPMGLAKGILAILLGHIIGCGLLYLAGIIGAESGKNAMETVTMSFGRKGSVPFSLMNILQLAGWLAILNYDGALAANGIFPVGAWVWCLFIGLLLLVWIFVGLERLEKINVVAMGALFLFTIFLCILILKDKSMLMNFSEGKKGEVAGISFGAAVELAAAMPLSWIPVISDYTSVSEKSKKSTMVSVITYGGVSIWMYLIGMMATINMGTSDLSKIALRAGLGVVGLLIIVFSTVTTNFLAAYSAGISGQVVGENFGKKIEGKRLSVLVILLGTGAAMIYPMDHIEGFLYLINSIFAPMIAIQIADYFILKKEVSGRGWDKINIVLWLVGLVLYRGLMHTDLVMGSTLPDIGITILLCVAVRKCELFFLNGDRLSYEKRLK